MQDIQNKYIMESYNNQKGYFPIKRKALNFAGKIMPYLDKFFTKQKWIQERQEFSNSWDDILLTTKRFKQPSLYASIEEIRKFQTKLMRIRFKLLNLMPYWHQKFKEKQIKPASVTLEDITSRPIEETIITTTQDLYENLDDLCLPVNFEKRLADAFTTGTSSSGTSKIKIYAGIGGFYYTNNSYHMTFDSIGIKPKDRILICMPIPASSGPGLVKSWGMDNRIYDYTPLPCYKDNNINDIAYNRLVYFLTKKSDVLFTYTPFLRSLYNRLEYILKNKEIKLKKIVCSGGALPKIFRKKFIDLFNGNLEISNIYGSVELSNMAFECAEGTLHTFPETLLRIDEKKGILGTKLWYSNTPLINYTTGDRTDEIITDCACGCKYLGLGAIKRSNKFELTKMIPWDAICNSLWNYHTEYGHIDRIFKSNINQKLKTMKLLVIRSEDYKLKGYKRISNEKLKNQISYEIRKVPFYETIVNTGSISPVEIEVYDNAEELPSFMPEIDLFKDGREIIKED